MSCQLSDLVNSWGLFIIASHCAVEVVRGCALLKTDLSIALQFTKTDLSFGLGVGNWMLN
jgi:hypothetical protein